MSDGRIVSGSKNPIGGMFFIPESVDGFVPINTSRIPDTSVPAVLASSGVFSMPVSRF